MLKRRDTALLQFMNDLSIKDFSILQNSPIFDSLEIFPTYSISEVAEFIRTLEY